MAASQGAVIAGSRPSRARGLKQEYSRAALRLTAVAPFTGAWIETGLRLT